MMRQQCKELLDLTGQTCQAEDWNNYRNYHLFDSHKMIDPKEGSLAWEDSLEEEDSPEVEDSLEEGDIRAEEECHPEDHQGVVGDHHCCPYNKPIKGN